MKNGTMQTDHLPYALIDCKCGWNVEGSVRDQKVAEVIAYTHEARDIKRAYRHETVVTMRGDK